MTIAFGTLSSPGLPDGAPPQGDYDIYVMTPQRRQIKQLEKNYMCQNSDLLRALS